MSIEPAKDTVAARDVAENGQPQGYNEVLAPPDKQGLSPHRSAIDANLRAILRDVLALDADQVEGFDGDTGLFGHLPELDSMAVASLFTEMEDRLEIIIEDDDVDGEMLETYGGLLAFAESKAADGATIRDSSN